MKKYIGLLLITIVNLEAFAGTVIEWNQTGCESVGGTWVQANNAVDTDKGCDADHCNSKTFCTSSVTMNWYSAFSWCESIGAQLVSISDACPNDLSSGKCTNLKGVSVSGWTATPTPSNISTARAWMVSNNQIGRPLKTENVYALCEPKSN